MGRGVEGTTVTKRPYLALAVAGFVRGVLWGDKMSEILTDLKNNHFRTFSVREEKNRKNSVGLADRVQESFILFRMPQNMQA